MKPSQISFIVALSAAAASAQNIECPTGSGVGIIVARASTERPGTGIIGSVADDVVAQVPGSTITAVDYPATLTNYQSSEAAGVAAMTSLMEEFNANCAGSQMVLMGYSQGAQVAADVLCGTSETGFATTQPVASDNVAAVILMGDPSHTPAGTFNNGGTAQNDGRFPRQDFSGCGAVAARTLSICNSGDTFCDSGASIATHLGYVRTDGDQATQFVVNAVQV